jgi:hypothetical protein
MVYRREVTRTPVRTLAAEIGISKSAVEHFYKEQTSPRRTWPRLRDWYVRSRGEKRQGYQTPPDVVLIAAERMLDEVPSSARPAAMRETAQHFRDLYESGKLPVPEWVGMLAKLADDTEKSETQN